jgi:signal peptidase I
VKNKKIREAADTLLCVFVTLLILYFVCRPFTIDGYSMEPALHDGDRVVVSKVLALVGDIKRSDIVVCRVALITASGANGGLETLVKRVVGLPGERVTITGGAVYLNGDVLTEPYLGNNSTDGEIDIVL